MAEINKQWKCYLGYLVRWANTHQDSGNIGMNPICFNEYLDNEYQENSYGIIDGLIEDGIFDQTN